MIVKVVISDSMWRDLRRDGVILDVECDTVVEEGMI